MTSNIPLVQLLGEQLLQHSTDESAGTNNYIATSRLHGKIIGLYFSGHWCPPSRSFTPKLVEAFKSIYNNVKDKFDIVFLSWDRDQNAFDHYYQEMPWKALPFSDRTRERTLREKFNVTGIPCLIVLSSTCEILTSEGVAEVNTNGADAIRRWSQGDDDRSVVRLYDANTTSGFFRHQFLELGGSGQAVESTETVIVNTTTVMETNEYLENLTENIYRPSSPQIVREVLTHMEDGSSGSNDQLICIRYLQPPALPPPGPLVIRELRPPQPAPPPTLVINEYPPLPEEQPPIILREEPPTPPPVIPSETVTKYLPPMPVPPRSVLIKRYPALSQRPPDVLIERWLPYGPRPERETITYPAPPAMRYSEPFFKIIQYDATQASVHRRLEKLFEREDPERYRARYGSSLLDAATLIQRAREAGVFEDLTLPEPSAISGHVSFYGMHGHHVLEGGNQHYHAFIRNGSSMCSYPHSETWSGSAISYETSSGGRYLHDEQYRSSKSSRRRGLFDYFQYGLLPADYTPGMQIYRKFVRPASFSFPASSMWSTRTAKYKVQMVDDRTTSVSVELLEDGVSVHSRTITEQEYKNAKVSSSAPKLVWEDFLQVLQVFMLGNNQEQESDIKRAFDILDQCSRGLYGRTIRLSDGLISPDELRAFLAILTDEYRVDLCVFLADTDGSGQISLSEFTRMVKSGLARDIICECI